MSKQSDPVADLAAAQAAEAAARRQVVTAEYTRGADPAAPAAQWATAQQRLSDAAWQVEQETAHAVQAALGDRSGW